MTVFNKNVIEIGDCVILRFGHDELVPLIIKENSVDQTKFGAVRHNDLINKIYGSKIAASKGFVHVLPLTPELWSLSLPHRTQIIYTPDSSLIVCQLDLQPGCTVAEAGTGSGALTHALSRAVAPNGHVFTFEFHEQRAKIAAQEFMDHKLNDLVTGHHRDVLRDGFPADLKVDAVMLDLPQPWNMVLHVTKVLKYGGRVCFFSPCIEQVQRTVENLRIAGFSEIVSQECVQRSYNIVRGTLDAPNIGQEFANGCVSCGATDGEQCQKEHRTKFTITSEQERWEAVPQNTTAGHTGYLTFASWVCQSE